MSGGRRLISLIGERQDREQFQKKNWTGTFEEYLEVVKQRPDVTRNAFQRVYDMVHATGTEVYEVAREKRVHYNFFDDRSNNGRDAVFGLDGSIRALVNAFKSAAHGYGIEKRVLLLHGPVGSSKSTIARLLKKGPGTLFGDGRRALYTLGWAEATSGESHWCPMNEEPLHLIPERFRDEVASANSTRTRRRPTSTSRSPANSARSAASCTASG